MVTAGDEGTPRRLVISASGRGVTEPEGEVEADGGGLCTGALRRGREVDRHEDSSGLPRCEPERRADGRALGEVREASAGQAGPRIARAPPGVGPHLHAEGVSRLLGGEPHVGQGQLEEPGRRRGAAQMQGRRGGAAGGEHHVVSEQGGRGPGGPVHPVLRELEWAALGAPWRSRREDQPAAEQEQEEQECDGSVPGRRRGHFCHPQCTPVTSPAPGTVGVVWNVPWAADSQPLRPGSFFSTYSQALP